MTAANANPVLANAPQRYEVRRSDLPLSCPLPSMGLWNSHPRVSMALENEGGASDYPYRGAHFVLVDLPRPRHTGPPGTVPPPYPRAPPARPGAPRARNPEHA